MVTSLVRPFGDFKGRKRGLVDGRLLKGGKVKSSGRRKHGWNFSNVLWVEDVLSVPSLRGSRDSCSVKHLYPHLLAIVPAHLHQLLC